MGAVGGAVVAGAGRVTVGALGALRVGRADRGLGGTVPPGVTEGTGARAGAVRMPAGVSGVGRVTAGAGDAGGFGDGSRCSVVSSTNGITVAGVIGPPAKLTPTMIV